ncbi:MAG TPA: C40 family peptidase [Mycobacteriales bacterium]|nr:C40 family peptidase [Mycobacteriales bacterium]
MLERFVAAGVAVTLAAGTATAVAGVADHAHTDRPRAATTAFSNPLPWLPSATPSASTGVASPAATAAPARSVRHGAPVVQPLTALHEADFLVIDNHQVTAADMQRIARVQGVQALDLVDYGRITVAGHPATAIGVGPSTFRAYTPKLTAQSDALWHSVAAGELTASFGMGNDAGLPLGQTVHVRGTRPMDLRIGAFASMLPGIDAVVARNESHGLGLPTSNAVVVSAPGADPLKVQSALRAAMGGSQVQLLRKVVVIRDAGSFLDRRQINTVLKAAYSRIGAPYVWGATGPAAFDCSGLVGWAYRQAGILLPRTSQQQWYAGPHVPLDSARPGDLLFWTYNPADPSDVDHVAIYAGDGKMIVAPHTGDFVRVRDVPLSHLAGVVRVDPAMAAQVGGPHF